MDLSTVLEHVHKKMAEQGIVEETEYPRIDGDLSFLLKNSYNQERLGFRYETLTSFEKYFLFGYKPEKASRPDDYVAIPSQMTSEEKKLISSFYAHLIDSVGGKPSYPAGTYELCKEVCPDYLDKQLTPDEVEKVIGILREKCPPTVIKKALEQTLEEANSDFKSKTDFTVEDTEQYAKNVAWHVVPMCRNTNNPAAFSGIVAEAVAENFGMSAENREVLKNTFETELAATQRRIAWQNSIPGRVAATVSDALDSIQKIFR